MADVGLKYDEGTPPIVEHTRSLHRTSPPFTHSVLLKYTQPALERFIVASCGETEPVATPVVKLRIEFPEVDPPVWRVMAPALLMSLVDSRLLLGVKDRAVELRRFAFPVAEEDI